MGDKLKIEICLAIAPLFGEILFGDVEVNIVEIANSDHKGQRLGVVDGEN